MPTSKQPSKPPKNQPERRIATKPRREGDPEIVLVKETLEQVGQRVTSLAGQVEGLPDQVILESQVKSLKSQLKLALIAIVTFVVLTTLIIFFQNLSLRNYVEEGRRITVSNARILNGQETLLKQQKEQLDILLDVTSPETRRLAEERTNALVEGAIDEITARIEVVGTRLAEEIKRSIEEHDTRSAP